MKPLTLTTLLLGAVIPALQADELTYPSFYAPYDADTTAVVARGKATPDGGEAMIVPDGKFGGAARFSALSGVAYRLAGNLSQDHGTIAFWVKPQDWADDDSVRTFLNAGSGAPYFSFDASAVIQKTGLKGPVTANIAGYGTTPTNTWANGEWHHVAVSYDQRGGRIYLDGAEAQRFRAVTQAQKAQGCFWVGNTPYMGQWAKTGLTFIDDFRIYDNTLDAAQIGAVMRGYQADVQRLADGQWLVTVQLDPARRGIEGAKVCVAGAAPVAVANGQAILKIPSANFPTGPVRLRVEVKDCAAKLDPVELITVKPAAPVLRLANNLVEIGFDPLDGRVLSLRNLATGTDYRKLLAGAPLFSLLTTPYANSTTTYQPDDVTTLAPSAASCQGVKLVREAGQQAVEIIHRFPPYLKVTCRVTLPDGSALSEWRIKVENQQPQRPSQAAIVQRVNYPLLDGLVIGADPKQNFLALPRVMGQLIPNPASGGAYQFADEPEKRYPGNASMSWMDLYGAGGGLYVGSHDPQLPATVLLSQGHPDTQSVSLGIGKYSLLWPGETFAPGPVLVGVHPGDWHWGADRYREYWTKNFAGRRKTPKWLESADAWTGFGGPSYKFSELPHLLEGAKPLGIDYLQLWSEMTFGDVDYQVPMWPNPFMGTPEELRQNIARVHRAGGHVGFYYFGTATDPQIHWLFDQEKYRGKVPADYIRRWFSPASGYFDATLMDAQGNFQFTDPIATFADGYWAACPNSRWQQEYVAEFVKRWAKYGVDCWYFDTFPAYGSLVCYNTHHGHARPVSVTKGVVELMRITQKAMDHGDGAAIANEWLSDICAIYGTHGLGNELQGWCQPPKPEIWRYTMPDYLIFTGHCNGFYLNGYPGYEDFDAAHPYTPANFLMIYGRVFLLGDRFDLLNTFTWRQSPDVEQTAPYIAKLLALRRKTKAHQYASDFKDDVGLTIAPPDLKLEAKLFRHRQGKSFTITLLDRRKSQTDVTLLLDLTQYSRPKVGPITLYTIDGKETPLESAVTDGRLKFVIPPRTGEVASVLILTK